MPPLVVTQLWIDDLLIHDVDDPALPYALKSAMLKRPPRRVTASRTQRHGSRSRSRYLESAIVDLAGYVSGSTFAEQADNFAELEKRLLNLGTPRVVRFLRRGMAEEEQMLMELVALEPPAEGYTALMRYTLTLEADDPAIYSAAQRSLSYDPSSIIEQGGVAMPLVFPLEFAATAETHIEAVNGGALESLPAVEVHGPISNPVVDNDTTGQSMQISYELGSSDVVTVDVAARLVLLNGAERFDLFSSASNWLGLAPGTNLIRLRGSGMVTDQTLLTLRWREAR